MLKTSRHKSHRQSKHSSKDAKEYSESEEDAKMRTFNKEEGSVKVSRNSGFSEKRKDHPGHSNGDVAEEYVGSKRRKDKAKDKDKDKERSDVNAVSDRWNGGGSSAAVVESEIKGESLRIDGEKTSTSKSGVDSKSKSSRVHDSGGEKKEENKEGSKVESKRKYEKESGRKEAHPSKDLKGPKEKTKTAEKEKVKERKVDEREVEDEVVDIGDAIIPTVAFGEEQEGRHVWPIQVEKNPELEKELAKRSKIRDVSSDKNKYQDNVKGSGDRRVSSRGEHAKDGKYKDDKYMVGSHGDKHREDDDRETRYKEEKYAEDVDRERRYKDAKYWERSEKVARYKDDKYHEDVDREKRLRDDKYREDGDRDNKHRDAKYREDADKDNRRRVDKYHEVGDREDRYRDDWYFEDIARESRNKEDKNWEDAGRDGRRREVKQRDDSVKDKRPRDIKYHDERLIKDGTNDYSDTKRSRDESDVAEFRYKRSINHDGSPNFDDRSTRYKEDRGKRRASDKEDYDDNNRSLSIKDQNLDIEKKSAGARVESLGNRGSSSLRDSDMVINPNHGRRGNSPSYRLLTQEESRYREYENGGRERRDVTPGKEYAGVSGVTDKVSRLNDKSFQKEDARGDDASSERRLKEEKPISPFQRVDRSPSSASNDRRNLQRTGGSKETKDYYGRDNNRGNREVPIENFPVDENSLPNADNFSVPSPFSKPSHFNNNNRSLPPTPFRGGPDRPVNDENRNKQNRRRRMDSNIGRNQGNAWRGVPNWPSPVANGFVPYQHGPPTLGFHPVMPQFPTPNMFGIRPSIEMNQSTVPFPGHGPMFGDQSHIYGRLDWDHSRNFNSGRGWETSRDMWKGQNTVSSTDLSAAPLKDDILADDGQEEENWPANSAMSAQTNKKPSNSQVESIDIDHSSDAVERDADEASKAIAEDTWDSKIRNDDYFARAYLSKLDISVDLCQFELYSQYADFVGVDQNENLVEDDSKLLIIEEDIDALGNDSNKTSVASRFCPMNDSIFQKAMSQYKKLKEEILSTGQDKVVSSPTAENTESALPFDPVEAASNDEEATVLDLSIVKKEADDETESALMEVKMEVDPVTIKKEIRDDSIAKDGSVCSNNVGNDGMENGKFVLCSGASAEVGVESGSVNLSRIHQSPKSTH